MHGIPKLTLHDQISGNVTNGDEPGPYQLLLPAEEEELSNPLVEVAQAGYGKTRKQIRNIASRVAVDKKRRKILDVSPGWFGRFMLRHPDLLYPKDELTVD